MLESAASARSSTSSVPRSVVNRKGRWSCGSGRRSASRADLLVLQRHARRAERRPRRASGSASPGMQGDPGLFGRGLRVGVEAGALGIEPVDDDRARGRRRRGPRGEYAVSTSSFTGVSSGRVTSTTWQRSGSVSISSTSRAWVLIGPTVTASSRPRADWRKVIAWPAAGASRTIRSASPARSSCLTLPSTRMSLMPGRGGRDDVERAASDEPVRDAGSSRGPQVLEQGVVGRERPGPDSPPCCPRPRAPSLRRSAADSRPNSRPSPLLPSTSTIERHAGQTWLLRRPVLRSPWFCRRRPSRPR